MNDYIRSALMVLNTNYPGYSFEIEEFGDCVLLWCRHQVRRIDTNFIKYTRIMNSDMSYEKIMEKGKILMGKINQDEFRSVVGWSDKNLISDKRNSYYGMWPGNKYYVAPKELIFQDEKTTIINWTDGTKTIVKCSENDTFSPEAGIALCYMKKFVTDNDSERFHRILKSLISVSKFKNNQDNKSFGFDLALMYKGLKNLSETLSKVHTTEDNHDIDTGTSDNSGDNDPDGSAVEVES